MRTTRAALTLSSLPDSVRHVKAGVAIATAAYTALIVFTFLQTLQGEPFPGFPG
jgi:hypothetical protein